jgi:hypothetical protein
VHQPAQTAVTRSIESQTSCKVVTAGAQLQHSSHNNAPQQAFSCRHFHAIGMRAATCRNASTPTKSSSRHVQQLLLPQPAAKEQEVTMRLTDLADRLANQHGSCPPGGRKQLPQQRRLSADDRSAGTNSCTHTHTHARMHMHACMHMHTNTLMPCL